MSKKVLGALACALLATACATAPAPVDQRNSALTHGNVQMNLQVGKTSQADVLEKFGAPNITTIDGAGNEVWSYQRHATVSQQSGSNSWNVVMFGSGQYADGFQETNRTITLIIKFDKSRLVSDFRSRTSDF